MSPKQRRFESRSAAVAGALSRLLSLAAGHHARGQLDEAEQIYRTLQSEHPDHPGIAHRLGIIAYQKMQLEPAARHLQTAIDLDGSIAAYHNHLSLALAGLGRLHEAAAAGAHAVSLAPDAADGYINLSLVLTRLKRLDEAYECCRRAVELAPEFSDAHNNFGAVCHALGKVDEAAACFRRALALEPDFAEAHTALGNALLDLGFPEDAAAHHCRAIDLNPAFSDAHNNLAQSLRHLGRTGEAIHHYQHAIALNPASAEAHNNLAGILKNLGRLQEAEASLRGALALTPDHPDVLNNLALVLLASGRPDEATRIALRALEIEETPQARGTFVRCIGCLQLPSGSDKLRPMLLRALGERWGRAESVAPAALDLVKQHTRLRSIISRANTEWPNPLSEGALYGEDGLTLVAADELLRALLCSTPNTDLEFERFLTAARSVLLGMAEADGPVFAEPTIAFHGALARQCFLNDYVFRLSEDERRRVSELRRQLAMALAAGHEIAPTRLLALACYCPLSRLEPAERLLAFPWPAPVAAVLNQQVVEIRAEIGLRASIPRLTPIRDPASLDVQAQYEQHPYPRWEGVAAAPRPQRLADYLTTAFPLAGLQPMSPKADLDILITGCGTGRNALETARSFIGSRTLAIDLSMASLAHAVRKAGEDGVQNLTFAQGDLLEIGSLGRDFDMIEASGVLHHLSDPMQGWRALLELLRPQGVMKLGLYSAIARRNLPQPHIEEVTQDRLRDVRQDLIAREENLPAALLHSQDFYTLSGCRDLFFHACEHRLTLGEIAAFISETGLRFLGFVLDEVKMAAYRRRFPLDPGAVDLRHWQSFERENPDTFIEMYQFWVQKP